MLSEDVKDNAGDKSFEVIRFNPRDKLMESILLKFTREVLSDEPKGVLVIKEAPSDVNVLVMLKSKPTELVTRVVVPGTKLMSNEIPPR